MARAEEPSPSMEPASRPAGRGVCGIGWRQPHYGELLMRREPLAFVEVHSENFFCEGGAALAVLREGRVHYPVSLHGVGLSLGSAAGLDDWHLERLAALVAAIEPARVSDHASFARVPLAGPGAQGVHHANDLLPVAFTEESLAIMAANVARVQDRLKRPLLVENLSAYLAWADDAIAEPEFFNELTRRTGCGLLLDVNNLVVNALNAQREPVGVAKAWIDALRPGIVGEIHLAGYSQGDGEGGLVVDDHGSRVHEPVWAVYRHAIAALGSCPTLIEWDTDIPDLDVLLQEADLAEQAVAEAGLAAVAQAGLQVPMRESA